MRITFTGRQVELAPAQLKKIQMRATKLGKLLDGKGEREAHVVLGLERGRHTAEITVNYFDHPLVGRKRSNTDMFTAIHGAIGEARKAGHQGTRQMAGQQTRPAPAAGRAGASRSSPPPGRTARSESTALITTSATSR